MLLVQSSGKSIDGYVHTACPELTKTSDYGSLALRTSCDDRSCDLPALRFESGDLVIKLTNDPRDWLLVHSEIVAASSPVLAASLSRAWAQYAHLDSIKHPSTGENVLVRTLALTQVEGTFFLEGKVFTDSNSPLVSEAILTSSGRRALLGG